MQDGTRRSTREIASWRSRFIEADGLPEDASGAEKRSRGRELERVLAGMFEEAGMRPRLSYRPTGEEVDGSIWLHGRTMLVEAKWTKDPHPASSLYQFRGKVEGKLAGTLGIFVSMAGFSSDAVDALVAGKELNLVLFDGDDLREIVAGHISIQDALEVKLRAAGDAGTPYLPLREATRPPTAAAPGSVIFVEGRFDQRVLEIVRNIFGAARPATIIPAAGPANMAPLINAIFDLTGGTKRLTAIVDGAGLAPEPSERLQQTLHMLRKAHQGEVIADLVPLEPDLDAAFGLVEPEDDWEKRRRLRRLSDQALEARLREADIASRTRSSRALATVLEAIGVDIPEIAQARDSPFEGA